jgi:hypothetical protein
VVAVSYETDLVHTESVAKVWKAPNNHGRPLIGWIRPTNEPV